MRKLLSLFLALTMLIPVTLSAYATKESTVYSFHANSSNKIAITFDDGPHPSHTSEILEILAEYGVPATFFVIGKNAELYPELVKREIDAGHEVGNHTFSHSYHDDNGGLRHELEETHEIIYETDEYSPKLFRPPEGRYNKNIGKLARDLDYKVVLWNLDTEDWRHTSPDSIVKEISEKVKSGDIILFHDYITGYSPTSEALRRLIPSLLERGFIFVTVSELLGSE